jgi:hypothetical protein
MQALFFHVFQYLLGLERKRRDEIQNRVSFYNKLYLFAQIRILHKLYN